MQYFYDDQRHLVCVPYSVENLHIMAQDLGISRAWFHRNHYDIPKYKADEVAQAGTKVRPRDILRIIKESS